MGKTHLLTLAAATAVWAPAAVTGAAVLAGKWKMNPALMRSTPENPITYEPIDNGWRVISPYAAPLEIILDGRERPDVNFAGRTVAYNRIDPHAYQIVTRSNGNTVATTMVVLSPGNREMTRRMTATMPAGNVLAVTQVYGRASAPGTERDPFLGTWSPEDAKTQYSDPLVEIIEAAGDTLRFKVQGFGAGSHEYSATADGEDHPISGWPVYDAVNIQQTGARTFARVFKKNGKPVTSDTLTVSPDGRTLTRAFETHPPGGHARTITIVFERE